MSAPSPLAAFLESAHSRRDFLYRAGAGFGSLALWSLFSRDAFSHRSRRRGACQINPLAPKPPHFPAKAKSVIWCFIDGGPSHLDLFDPKPNSPSSPASRSPKVSRKPETAMGKTAFTPLLASQRKFKQYGQSGIWVSDWYPEIATCVDDMAVIRSCWADGLTHVSSVCEMNTGSIVGRPPVLGRMESCTVWAPVTDSLPGFVVMTDYQQRTARRQPAMGHRLHAFHVPRHKIPRRQNADPARLAHRRIHRRSPAAHDRLHPATQSPASCKAATTTMASKPASPPTNWPTACSRPRRKRPISPSETAETLALYGIDKPETAANGRNCLMARRLVERGVRFVQLYMGSGSKWDAHSDVEGNHSQYCRETDRPDRRPDQRPEAPRPVRQHAGHLGRRIRPHADERKRHRPRPQPVRLHHVDGRRRHQKRGTVYGATDEVGLYAVENKAHVHDIHATILALLGLDHEQLTFQHNGRDERLTITSGTVIKDIIA